MIPNGFIRLLDASSIHRVLVDKSMGCKGSSVRITPSRPIIPEKAQSVTIGLFCARGFSN